MKHLIDKMISNELDSANEKFPQFASRHEGWAVIREEFEEAVEKMDAISYVISGVYWSHCRQNGENKDVLDTLEALESDIIDCIGELIQLGAMCRKAKVVELKS